MKGKLTVLLGTALLAGWAMPAWGLVTAEDPSVPKDAETEITFSVPVEEGGHAHAMHAMHEGHDQPGAGENKGEPSTVYNQEVTISSPARSRSSTATRRRSGTARPSRPRAAPTRARPPAAP